MKKKVIGIFSILSIIIVAVTGALIYNYDHIGDVDSGEKAIDGGVLPDVDIFYGSTVVCRPNGYIENIGRPLDRECMIPVSYERHIPFTIHSNHHQIQTVSYEIKSADEDRLVDCGDISNVSEDKGNLKFEYTASTIIEPGKDYYFSLVLHTDRYDQIFYYAKMMLMEKEFVSAQIQFLQNFSDMTFHVGNTKKIGEYLESDLSNPNDNLGRVTIQSNDRMLMWNDLAPKRVGDVWISAKEFCIKDTGEAGTYTLNYRIQSVDAKKTQEYYNVAETVTVWTCSGKQYILAYDREVNQIWSADDHNIGNGFIDLGIQNTDKAEFLESTNQQYLAFAINGDVYVMDVSTKTVTPVYRLDAKNAEMLYATRTKLLRVDDAGNVDYVIYGYSLAKQHMGQNGISVMKYHMKQKKSEECLFIPCNFCAGEIQVELSKLCYLGDEALYMKLGCNIYYVNLQTKEIGKLVENMEEDSFRVSQDGSMLAYNAKGQHYDEESIKIVNLNTGQMQTIPVGSHQAIKVFGYTDDNLVYGLADQKDMKKAYSFFPAKKLIIADKDLKEIKSYEKSSMLITDVEISDTIIHIKRWQNGKKMADDQLLFNPQRKTPLAYSSCWMDDIKKNELAIAFSNSLNVNIPLVVEDNADVCFDINAGIKTDIALERETCYYIYGYGKLQGILENEKEAIRIAKQWYGLVTDDKGRKIWTFEEHYNEKQ